MSVLARHSAKALARGHRLLRLLCTEPHTTPRLLIDPDLLARALKISGEPTNAAAVTKALQEFITRREPRGAAELLGKLEWDKSYDDKAERTRRN